MKKLLSLLLAATLLVPAAAASDPMPNGSAAASVYNYTAGRYGSGSLLPVVNLTLDGSELSYQDVPAFVWGGRTMIPVRLVGEALGAQVLWVEETSQVILLRGDDTVVLTLGSAKATVNGKTTTLPDGVPATAARCGGAERTMVPLRFVAEQLGGQVSWDQDTYTAAITAPRDTVTGKVLDVDVDSDAQTVLIATNYQAAYHVQDFGDRVVVDVPGAVLASGLPGKIGVDNELISSVRFAQHGNDLYENWDNTVRVVLDLRDGITYQDNVKVERADGGILITTYLSDRDDLDYTPTVPIDPQKKTVVLDPGHGGERTGALYEGIEEKNINLSVALKVQSILKGSGYNVVMTRTGDVDVGLYERADIANAVKADLFVSIHSNALPESSDFQGIFTFYHTPSARGAKLAQAIQTPLAACTGGIDRGIRSADFVVLRETDMCAALVEMGFMTNHEELMRLTTNAYQNKLAKGIAGGIIDYLNSVS